MFSWIICYYFAYYSPAVVGRSKCLQKKYFSVFTHLSSRILLRKNGFLLNVENCIELTYWHVKSIQNLSCSDKRMTPLSISLKVKYISILAIVILCIFTKAYLLFHKAPLKYWHHDWYSRKNAQSISPLYLVKLLGGSNACILLTIIVLRLWWHIFFIFFTLVMYIYNKWYNWCISSEKV